MGQGACSPGGGSYICREFDSLSDEGCGKAQKLKLSPSRRVQANGGIARLFVPCKFLINLEIWLFGLLINFGSSAFIINLLAILGQTQFIIIDSLRIVPQEPAFRQNSILFQPIYLNSIHIF